MGIRSTCWTGAIVVALWLGATSVFGQGTLFEDQTSGTADELVLTYIRLPNSQIAQSFTPSLSAVGFVQLRVFTTTVNDGVALVVNLRQGGFDGPIVSSTTPVVIVRGAIQTATFYFPYNIAVTAGQMYFFEPVLQSAGEMDVGYKSTFSYPGGEAWNNGVPAGDMSDFWFREGVVGVPEPGGVVLLILGAGVLLWRRRCREN